MTEFADVYLDDCNIVIINVSRIETIREVGRNCGMVRVVVRLIGGDTIEGAMPDIRFNSLAAERRAER